MQPPTGAAVRSKFDPSTAPAVTPADWPPRPKTAYSHLSGHLTAGRSASRHHDASSAAGCGARAAAVGDAAAASLGSCGSSGDRDAAGTAAVAGEASTVTAGAQFDPERTLRDLQALPLYTGQVVHVERTAAKSACFAELERPLPPALASTLAGAGLSKL
jgi:hypothetical protein